MVQKSLSRSNPKVEEFYQKSLKNFRAQFDDVTEIRQLYINAEGKVYAGEWLDSKGVINFNSGWAIDCVKSLSFKP